MRSAPEPLGVGVLYNPAVPELTTSDEPLVDFVSVTPERFWHDSGPSAPARPDADPSIDEAERGAPTARFREAHAAVEQFRSFVADRPIVAHGIALSIGTAGPLDTELVAQIDRWRHRFDVRWYSEHLNALVIPDDDGAIARHAGVALPVPYDHDTLDELAAKIGAISEIVPLPFLLENGVAYCPIPDQEMSEPAFLNELGRRSGCGVLLDLHNLFVEAVNHGTDLAGYLDELDLDQVIEVHVAGGNTIGRQYTDAHAGPCPEAVWELLDEVVGRAPNLAAVTFEFHESYGALLGPRGLQIQLERAHAAWARRPARAGDVAA